MRNPGVFCFSQDYRYFELQFLDPSIHGLLINQIMVELYTIVVIICYLRWLLCTV